MADVKALPSIPCEFELAWQGKCKKPSTNGWCSGHENQKCISCGEKATKDCAHTGSLVCGANLCPNCVHSPDDSGERHVSKKVADEFDRKKADEEKARIDSRANREVVRMNEELGVPLNLFELLKKRPVGYKIQTFFYLELEHGRWAFFPAIFAGTKRIIVTTDIGLIERVWRSMEPRESKLVSNLGYINEEAGVVYPMVEQNPHEQEESKPQKLLTQAEFKELEKSAECPFVWAPGLFGGRDLGKAEFQERIETHIAKGRAAAFA